MFSSCFPTLCLIQQNSLSSLPSLNCSKTWVVIFMGKSRFRLPTSILKFTYSTKLDTCNINSSDHKVGSRQPSLKIYVEFKRWRGNIRRALPTLKFQSLWAWVRTLQTKWEELVSPLFYFSESQERELLRN